MATASPTSMPTAADNGSDLAFERELFAAADKLRSNMAAAEYKHVVLGLTLRPPAESSTKKNCSG